jgi:hypothetical protein
MILLALGAIGDYVARTYEETKNRPLYVVTECSNLPLPQRALTRAVILAEPDPMSVIAMDDADRLSSGAEDPLSYHHPLAGMRV